MHQGGKQRSKAWAEVLTQGGFPPLRRLPKHGMSRSKRTAHFTSFFTLPQRSISLPKYGLLVTGFG